MSFYRGNSPFSLHFLVNSAGINSSPDSSYFVHHQADKYLCGESANVFLSSFAGQRNFCLLAEEVPFILLSNVSATEAI